MLMQTSDKEYVINFLFSLITGGGISSKISCFHGLGGFIEFVLLSQCVGFVVANV